MTIAAGFMAQDGVLLCTDSLYTGGVKSNGKKIFSVQLDGGVAAFALAGHEPFAKRAIEECCRYLETNRDQQRSVSGIKDTIELALKDFCEKFVFTRPADERQKVEFKLLVAIGSLAERPSIFAAHDTVLIPIPGHECFGAGYFVGHHIIENAYSPSMSVDQAAVLAIHAVAMAKEYVDGVGGPTQLLWIRDGVVSPFHPLNTAVFTENYIHAYEREAAQLLFHAANPKLSEEDFQKHGERFLGIVGFIRKRWRERYDNQDILEMLMHPGGPADPEPPKPCP